MREIRQLGTKDGETNLVGFFVGWQTSPVITSRSCKTRDYITDKRGLMFETRVSNSRRKMSKSRGALTRHNDRDEHITARLIIYYNPRALSTSPHLRAEDVCY